MGWRTSETGKQGRHWGTLDHKGCSQVIVLGKPPESINAALKTEQ